MDKSIIKFDDTEITRYHKFYQHKSTTISIKNIDVNEIVVCNKVSFGKKGSNYWLLATKRLLNF